MKFLSMIKNKLPDNTEKRVRIRSTIDNPSQVTQALPLTFLFLFFSINNELNSYAMNIMHVFKVCCNLRTAISHHIWVRVSTSFLLCGGRYT